MKKCNKCDTVALNDNDECCRECWCTEFTEATEPEATTEASKSDTSDLLCDFIQMKWQEEDDMQATINPDCDGEMRECYRLHEINKVRYEQIIRRLKNGK